MATSYRFRVRAQDSAGHWSPWVEAASPTRIYGVDDRSTAVKLQRQLDRLAYTYAGDGT